ncbi:MAG TPA: hypothetical protein VFU29_06885 [Chitinophagaceae bacterium]|nr:hypothetical protein [Chitinophagaceae bacterium]
MIHLERHLVPPDHVPSKQVLVGFFIYVIMIFILGILAGRLIAAY